MRLQGVHSIYLYRIVVCNNLAGLIVAYDILFLIIIIPEVTSFVEDFTISQ